MWAFEPDPIKGAQMMIEHIDKKRKALGIDKARERVLYDMEMRRELVCRLVRLKLRRNPISKEAFSQL